MSEVFTVFYCWQSDTNQGHTRHLIREALDAAADRISTASNSPFRVAVHSDTENEPGLCNIPETILRRLREADAIVSDLTFVAKTNDETKSKHCSNPNVLFELGYAFKSIGPERIICVMNEAHGEGTNQVFDLAHHRRPIGFRSPCDGQSRAKTVESLSVALEAALLGVIKLGLSGGTEGDDEIRHQRHLSEIEDYWSSIAKDRNGVPRVSLRFRPKLFRERRWPNAQAIEEKVREHGAMTDRFQRYPPQPTGNAPMNWGLYNDTYGDPWTLTYAGQYWTEMRIETFQPLDIGNRDARVSPEPPESLCIAAGQWIQMDRMLSQVSSVFHFVRKLSSEFSDFESIQWTLDASNLDGKWLNTGWDTRGPSKARTIKRDGSMLVSDFKSKWLEVFTDFAKDICDLFCRDGRVFSCDDLKQYQNHSGNF